MRSLQLFFIACQLFLGDQMPSSATVTVPIGVLYEPGLEERVFALKKAFEGLKVKVSKCVQHKVISDRQDLLSSEVRKKFRDVDCLFDLGTNNEQVYALSSTIGVPLLKINAIITDVPYNLTLSMMPAPRTISKALITLVSFYKFKTVAVVYDARRRKLANLFQSLSTLENVYKITMIPALRLNDKEYTRNALKVLLTTRIKNVVLICASNDMASVMYEALSVGVYNEEYKWIASDVDTWGVNKTYMSLWGMTGLRMHLRNEKKARNLVNGSANATSPTQYATIRDAVYLLSRVLQNGRKTGDKLFKSIKNVRYREGLTGEVAFDQKTAERQITPGLDFVNIRKDDIVKIGTIIKKELSQRNRGEPHWVGFFTKDVKQHKDFPRLKTPLVFTAVIEPPFVLWRNESQKTWPVKNDSLVGFLIDLIKQLHEITDINYMIKLRKDRSYKAMLQELTDKEADAVLAPITISAERQGKYDFTKPFYDFKMSLIMQKPDENAIDLFAFLRPFTEEVWLSMVGVVLFVTVAVFAIDYMSPFGYRALAQETGEGTGDELNLFNSLWFATGSMLGQGGDNTPRTPAGRILGAAFWFFILIMISTYTANLAAFFTLSRTGSSINSLKDLVEQDKIKYGVLKGGSVGRMFETSPLSLHRALWSHMTQHDTFVPSTLVGVKKVRKENYAYLSEEPYLQYWNQKEPCDTMLLNNLLEPKSYGIAMQRDSPHTKRFSVAILQLREKGVIARLRKKWWDEKSQCTLTKQKPKGNTESLGVQNVAGVFIILLGGVLCALLLLIVEIRCKKVVDFLTKGQSVNALKRRGSVKSLKSHQDASDDDEFTKIPVRVVIAQGDKVLKPLETPQPPGEDTNSKWWRSWFS